MSVSVSQDADSSVLRDIIAGGPALAERMQRFEGARAHADHARQLRIEAEAMKAEAADILEKAKLTGAEADAKLEAAKAKIEEIVVWEARFEELHRRLRACLERDAKIRADGAD